MFRPLQCTPTHPTTQMPSHLQRSRFIFRTAADRRTSVTRPQSQSGLLDNPKLDANVMKIPSQEMETGSNQPWSESHQHPPQIFNATNRHCDIFSRLFFELLGAMNGVVNSPHSACTCHKQPKQHQQNTHIYRHCTFFLSTSMRTPTFVETDF